MQPPVESTRVEDVLSVVDADTIVMKIDVEGYECKVSTCSIILAEILLK